MAIPHQPAPRRGPVRGAGPMVWPTGTAWTGWSSTSSASPHRATRARRCSSRRRGPPAGPGSTGPGGARMPSAGPGTFDRHDLLASSRPTGRRRAQACRWPILDSRRPWPGWACRHGHGPAGGRHHREPRPSGPAADRPVHRRPGTGFHANFIAPLCTIHRSDLSAVPHVPRRSIADELDFWPDHLDRSSDGDLLGTWSHAPRPVPPVPPLTANGPPPAVGRCPASRTWRSAMGWAGGRAHLATWPRSAPPNSTWPGSPVST